MSVRLLHPDEYELVTRSSLESQESFNLDEADFESHTHNKPNFLRRGPSLLSRLLSFSFAGYRLLKDSSIAPLRSRRKRASCSRRLSARRLCFYFHVFAGVIVALIVLTFLFWPSYTRLPPHYEALRRSVLQSKTPGRGNPRNEKVFIAASLYDREGDLAGGQWGRAVLQLIELLGEDNVFLSIYENDSGPRGESALREFEQQVTCNKSILFEEHLNLADIPAITLPDGSKRIKRIAYLAEVRNRALRPLDEHSDLRYDKLLYLNDVVFDPIDAVQLLFSTNASEDGVARYRAACSVDFINAFKFYDTYATRDLQGYSMGVPFFPWFTTAGNGQSRKDVLEGKDAVRVRSCWGGMVAFDAKFFQSPEKPQSINDRKEVTVSREYTENRLPVRFRSEPELFWDASECCLIHADIQDPPSNIDEITDTGIYMNPFVRVAYDGTTLSWLRTTRRFEKLYSPIHNIVNHLVGMPRYNPRRGEVPGQEVEEKVWVPDAAKSAGGSFLTIKRVAGNSGFCGRQGLQVIVENRQPGQKGWESLPVPTN